ncbi:MAG: minor capsid protein [Selenomonadaceae bacterium]|nr:minor capsid protein [Selenomonadaceae bacterium]
MDMQEYLKQIEATGDKKLLRELNTLAMRSRISRLDKLKAETYVELSKLAEKFGRSMDKFLPTAYKDFYYRNLFEIGRKRGLASTPAKVESNKLENVLRAPWSGKNYSARIWANQEKLAEILQREITAAMHRGASVENVSKIITQKMGVGMSDARRLVRTELNYVQNRAALDSIKDAGMKYYRFVATLDRRTSVACRAHDGKIYPVDEGSPGTNMPPLHPHCRSTITGSLKGDSIPKGSRAARDEAGKYIRVPADMKYEDWKAVYIDGKMTIDEYEKSSENDIIKVINSLINKKAAKDMSIVDVQVIGRSIREGFAISENLGNKEYIKQVYSNFREMGGSVEYAKGSSQLNRQMLDKAFEFYPKDWSEYLNKSGKKVYTLKVRRGFFVNGAVMANGRRYASNLQDFRNGYVSIHMSGGRKTTPFHEIGHMVEHFRPDALRISKEFVSSRTVGETPIKLKDLFPDCRYSNWEITKKDNFISPYIGKEYPNASEVLSMGLEQIFEPTDFRKSASEVRRITDDEDYLDLILGMLAVF